MAFLFSNEINFIHVKRIHFNMIHFNKIHTQYQLQIGIIVDYTHTLLDNFAYLDK